MWKGLNITLASLRWLLIVVTSLVSASLPGCMADKLGESQNYRKHVAMIYNITWTLINRCSFCVGLIQTSLQVYLLTVSMISMYKGLRTTDLLLQDLASCYMSF